MKKVKKLFTLITLSAISMLPAIHQVSAQTDTLRNAGTNAVVQDTSMRTNTKVRDSSMLRSASRDSMRLQRRMMRDTAQMHYRQRAAMKDTMGHLEKPLPPGNATPSKKPAPTGKPFSPDDKQPAEKNTIKPDKNKNIYLVPDSTLRKDTLK